ncbi:DUF1934 domain-containing protein [Virgibacillus oceani]|uniref:DUF1934 domain-containing protein n=1 Tax=Virgibacillus oceani TaxID=1479511 RepID=A0A917HR60_9BACI|nr:DUF1934 domain-containing protein [Virgibacillus oceani]GGG87747.1 hypothetical protein GCM10011398_37060 [Virgibacillus oceani]
MILQQIPVTIELHMSIKDNGQIERTTTNAFGTFYRKNKFDVVTYDEQLEDRVTIKSLYTIQADKVSVKRSGALSMHQQFQLNQITENLYKHPHGNFHMETCTDYINYQPFDKINPGKLTIHYTVKLNGQEKREHELILSIKEENPQ